MVEHHATVVVHAPVHQVYELFTHFNDFPKFMSFVKEVTYHDDQRSHWVAEVAGTHEWDAVNEDWIPDQQIGWRSTNGLQNSGRVKFMAAGPGQTTVDVYISYVPPGGVLGSAVEKLGFDNHFDTVLQRDLDHFAQMVEQAPAGALDPMQSHYLFHSESAVARDQTTTRQREAMANDRAMSPEELSRRERRVSDEREQAQLAARQRAEEQERSAAQLDQAARERETVLRRQAEEDRRIAGQEAEQRAQRMAQQRDPDPVADTIGGRNAAMERTAIGDQDARSERFPLHAQDPMTSRAPSHGGNEQEQSVAETQVDSPWRVTIRGSGDGRPATPESEEGEERG